MAIFITEILVKYREVSTSQFYSTRLLITIKNSRHNLFGKEHLEAVRVTAIEILFYKMVGDEDTIY
jgi:hypothetical protein